MHIFLHTYISFKYLLIKFSIPCLPIILLNLSDQFVGRHLESTAPDQNTIFSHHATLWRNRPSRHHQLWDIILCKHSSGMGEELDCRIQSQNYPGASTEQERSVICSPQYLTRMFMNILSQCNFSCTVSHICIVISIKSSLLPKNGLKLS